MSILKQFELKGKTALVTGCSRGIGKSIAIALAEAGANIIGISTKVQGQDSSIAKEIKKVGITFTSYACDLSDRKAIPAWIEEIKKNHPTLDILINNAGTIKRAPAVEHSDEYWDEVMGINLTAPFILAREFAKEMIQRKQGRIIFTASLLSFQGGILVPGYAASKGGIRQLIMALSNEWAPHGVTVNGIAPGYIETDNTEALRQDPQRSQSILSRIPMNRWGKPEDLAGAAVFLSSRAADYISGSILTVDGGWMGR